MRKICRLLAPLVWLLFLAACGGGGGTTATVASIAITPTTTIVAVGGTQRFTAVASDASGNVMNGITFNWTSSSKGVATIAGTGLATGVAVGSSNIKASLGGVSSNTVALTVAVASTVTGTAARAAALVGATIDLVDSKGKTTSATSSNDGSYKINTTGLTPPFLVSTQVDAKTTLYSVSADANTASVINIHPLTDLIIRTWYNVQGVSMTTAFANPASNPPPDPMMVQLISNAEERVFSLWLQKADVDTGNFNPISTTFSADGKGLDAVLDETSIDTTTGQITITQGAVKQVTTLNYNTKSVADRNARVTDSVNSSANQNVLANVAASTSSVTASSTTTGTSGFTSSMAGTALAVTPDQQAALAAIATTIQNIADTVNTNGNALTSTDLMPFIDPNALNDGFNATLYADELVTELRGATIAPTIQQINSIDTTNGVADIIMSFFNEQNECIFTDVNGTWLFSGDQQVAQVEITAQEIQAAGLPGGPVVNVTTNEPQGTVSAVTVTGGNSAASAVFNNVTVPSGLTIAQQFAPTPTTTVNANLDQFSTGSAPLTTLLPAGTPFVFTITTATGSASYTRTTGAATTDPVTITTVFAGSTLADANLGTPQTVTWTLPTTYAITGVIISTSISTALPNNPAALTCFVGPNLPATATSTTFTIPSTCDGQPVVYVNLAVVVLGADGERSQDSIVFQ